MYVFFLVWTALFLQLLPLAVTISSPGPLTREVGEDVVFMFNATNIAEVLWGIRDGDTSNLRQGLISYNIQDGVQLDKKLDSSSYAGRVSFVGDVTKGQAWFKIRNLNINDTNEYMAKLRTQGASNYRNIPVKLTVIQPVSSSSLGPLTRRVGEHVVFMFNTSTNILEVSWGIRDGDTLNLKLGGLITVDTSSGVQANPNLPSTSYAGRVSFVGNLRKGQAWFKITNLNISDSNQYMANIRVNGASGYDNMPVMLTVRQAATTAPATNPLQTTTRFTVSSLPSNSLPKTSSSVSGPSNQTILIRLVKERFKDLSDVNSAAFKNFSESFVSEINIAYGFADNFRQAKVTSLSEDSIPVKFVLYFEDKINPREVCASLEKAIKDNRLGRFKVVPGSLECYTEPTSSTPKKQSSSECACTIIIAVCVTAIVLLILVITFLLIYIWRGKVKAEKCAKSTRRSSKLKEEELGAYENAQIRVESVSGARSTEMAKTLTSGKELYETIKENTHEGTISGTTTSRRPPANTQGYLSSLPKHYQQLRRETPQPIPLYEPLDQRNIGDYTETESTGDTKTYEQLQQNKPGREYQSLKKYANIESKV